MPRPLLAAAFILCLTGSGALAKSADASADASLAPAFRGTIISTYPDGRTAKLWLNADGRYTAAGRRGDRSSGHWKVKGGEVCLSQSRPIPSPFSFCTPKPTTSTWRAKAVSGEPITVHVERGGRTS
jgi:hypothetical protein